MFSEVNNGSRFPKAFVRFRERRLFSTIMNHGGKVAVSGFPFRVSICGITVLNASLDVTFFELVPCVSKLMDIALIRCKLCLNDLRYLESIHTSLISIRNSQFSDAGTSPSSLADIFLPFAHLGLLYVTSDQMSKEYWLQTGHLLASKHPKLTLVIDDVPYREKRLLAYTIRDRN